MKEYKVTFPFCRGQRELYDADKDEYYTANTWEAGCEDTFVGMGSDCIYTELMANAEGVMILTEVGRYKPAHFPERVFYTREFINPDGVRFGNKKCRIATASKFRKLCEKYHKEYKLTDKSLIEKHNGISFLND